MTFYKMFMVGASAVLLLLIILGIIPKHHHQSFPPSSLEKPRLLDNYTMALNKALLFFDSQRSGVLPRDNNISWRGNSCTRDGLTTAHKNLVGGYYDAGDAVKFNFPASFAMTMLSWSVIEYRAQYEAAGELDHVKNIIKWGIDYFLKCFASESPIDHIVAQVGLGGFPLAHPIPNDHYCWMRPEDIDYPRPVSTCQSCSDLPAEMAAALASASLVFGDNVTYSEKLVHAAKSLFQFSMDHPGTYSILGSDAAKYYDSTNFHDEYVWGAAWMYYATGDPSYIEFATKKDNADFSGAFGRVTDYAGLSWDNKIAGALVLLSRLRIFLGRSYKEVLKVYHEQANLFMCSYLPLSSQFSRTRGGLILINQEDPHRLQYVVNAAFLAALYSDYLKVSETPGILCGSDFVASGVLRNFSKNQVDYILGKNPQNMSYVVGYGIKYPLHVHHRGASIPHNGIKYSCTGGWKWRDTPKANPNTIVGALVAGPDENDGFKDNRRMMNYTEPRLAGNAGLVGALVALSGDGSIRINKSSMFSFVPAAKFPPPPPPPTPWIH